MKKNTGMKVMNINLPKSKSDFKAYLYDPLFKNSIFIMLTSISTSIFGFIFWILTAKFYSQEDLGIATALISSINLLILLSRFGLDQSITRYLPERNQSKIFVTSTVVIIISTLIFGIIFIMGIDLWSPKLNMIKEIAYIYLVFLVANSITFFIGTAFIALRKSNYYFIQSILTGSRILFIFPFIYFGALGIFCSVGASVVLTLLFSIYFLHKCGVRTSKLDKEFLKDSFHYSVGNYIAGILISAPNQILPLMILNLLGAQETAQFYIVYAIYSLLLMIPASFSISLFVEGSHGENLKKTTLRSLAAIFFLLIPAVIFFCIFGKLLLGVYGQNYIGAFDLLIFMTFSSFFVAICQIYSSITRVQSNYKGLIGMNFLTFVSILGLSYIFMSEFGMIGIGYAWVIGYGLSSLVAVILVMREI